MNKPQQLADAAMDEFKHEIIEGYIKPLFDARGKLKLKQEKQINSSLVEYFEHDNGDKVFRFFPCVGTNERPSPFYCEIGTYSSHALKKRLEAILRELLRVAEYNCSNNTIRRQRSYGTTSTKSSAYKKRTLDLAFEIGMCMWIASDNSKAATLYAIVCKMIEWAGKTYEGKKMPFGFVIDFDREAPTTSVSYLSFLENNNSAVFTDGVFSGIMLDRAGRIISFLTRSSQVDFNPDKDTLFVPYQFHDLAKHCGKNRVGIIVLTNGEIILIKNWAICFAKRGTKWVSFDWERIYTSLRPYFLLSNNSNELVVQNRIKEIYCTLLDVSFSHTGGCLAVVIPEISIDELSKIIRDRFDLSVQGGSTRGISGENIEKIGVLKHLLSNGSNTISPFYEIDKPLRKEILSLDGATVVSLDGSFYCVGSIVSISPGSSGGGRTAAAKRLARLGIGIKVSEDGYIEAYGAPIKNDRKGGKNPKIVPLFKIK